MPPILSTAKLIVALYFVWQVLSQGPTDTMVVSKSTVTLEVFVSLTVARRRSDALSAVALLITQQLSMESVGFCSFSDAQS